MEKIDSFGGKYDFLSNFYPAVVPWEGVAYPTSEHAYQAAKTLCPFERRNIALLATPGIAKRAGKKLNMRDDWKDVRLSIMGEILRIKFSDPELLTRLCETHPAELIEGNHWGDQFWGVCEGKGQNNLGKILMEIRNESTGHLPGLLSLLE